MSIATASMIGPLFYVHYFSVGHFIKVEQSQDKANEYQNRPVLIRVALYVLLLSLKVIVASDVHAADLLIVELEKWLQLRGLN